MNERRQAIRARRILSIQYRLVKSRHKRKAATRWYLSTTHDMSALGLSFISEAAYQMDDVLELHMIMSGVVDIYKGFGKVVRVEEKASGDLYLIAVKFIEDKG